QETGSACTGDALASSAAIAALIFSTSASAAATRAGLLYLDFISATTSSAHSKPMRKASRNSLIAPPAWLRYANGGFPVREHLNVDSRYRHTLLYRPIRMSM